MFAVNNSLKMFLLLAQELSFVKAANKAFITQQCLSDHIKRLEEKYGTKLFYRKPKVALTPAGEILKEAVLQISLIENNLESMIDQLKHGVRGTLHLGINPNRAAILLPRIFPAFHEKFPYVNLKVHLEDTAVMEEAVREGKIDAFMGVNVHMDMLFDAMYLAYEDLYLVISDKTVKKYFADDYPKCVDRFSSEARLEYFQHIPTLQRNSPSRLTDVVEEYCCRNNIILNTIFSINDFQTQLDLCRRMDIQVVMSSMCIQPLLGLNHPCAGESRLYAFPLKGLDKSLRLDFIVRHCINHPCYVREIYESIKKECQKLIGRP